MRADGARASRHWTLRQRLSLRASSMLLLALAGVGVGYRLVDALGVTAAARWLGAAGSMAWAIGGVAAIVALAAFVASFVRRAPQLQFAGEFVLAIGLFASARGA